MYSTLQSAARYLYYLLNASNGKGHGIHSPFVFEFVQKVLNDRKHYEEYRHIEALRKKLLSDHTRVPTEDYGAGSGATNSSKTVAQIAANAAKPAKYAQLLYRIAKHYRPQYIVELGTSLGISAAYLATAHEHSVMFSGEGNPFIAEMARKNLASIGLPDVRVVTGNFDTTLPQLLEAVPGIDLAFVDGNHRREPTLDYFQAFLPKMCPDSMIVFDDIHWSAGMESAWKKIKEHPAVMLTIDLFFIGIVVFRPGFKVKQHFMIRF